MATYEFACKVCGIVGEENRRIRDRALPYLCKSCGNVCQRQMSTNTFHLKGVCWSKDRYQNKGTQPPKINKGKL
jgi:putative FmdB family regulatory protein